MRVSHEEDCVTHAVIGGSTAINFSISDSAEFYHLLSSTLYSNQELAVVREIICNAWDAHIEAGKTDIPIKISCSKDKLVIQDYGKGIPSEKMGDIYCTYGNSTKQNDGNQTGGFGLGCKAPFAYTDHFEVVNCNDNIKTVYNLSKSSAKLMGKPAMIKIVSMLTEETGITVTIPIKKSEDSEKFLHYIKRIIYNGDMNAIVNDNLARTLQFDTKISNYIIVNEKLDTDNNRNIIFIRYGNVIYPIELHEAFNSEYQNIIEFLRKLSKKSTSYTNICFQAPPHSLSVTPSRESLAMSEETIETISKLFKKFIVDITAQFMPKCKEYAFRIVDIAVAKKDLRALLSSYYCLPQKIDIHFTYKQQLRTLDDCVESYMEVNYPYNFNFFKSDLNYRLRSLINDNLIDKGTATTFCKELKKNNFNSKWFQKRIVAKLVTKLSAAHLNPKNLYMWSEHNKIATSVFKYRPPQLMEMASILQNIVIISYGVQSLRNRFVDPRIADKLGKDTKVFVYRVGKKKDEVKAVRAFFAKTSYDVIDLTKVNPDISIPKSIAITEPVKPKQKGVPVLTSLMRKNSLALNNIDSSEPKIYITNPEFVFNIAAQKNKSVYQLNNFTNHFSEFIVNEWGHLGGIVTSTRQQVAYEKKGAKSLFAFVRDKVIPYITNNKRITNYLGTDYERITYEIKKIKGRSNYDIYNFIQSCYQYDSLKKHFKIEDTRTKKDITYWDAWQRGIQRHPDAVNDPKIAAAKVKLDVPLTADAKNFIKLIVNSKYIEYININYMYNKPNITDSQFIDFIMTVLNHK